MEEGNAWSEEFKNVCVVVSCLITSLYYAAAILFKTRLQKNEFYLDKIWTLAALPVRFRKTGSVL